MVAGYLDSPCTGSLVTFTYLPPTWHYDGPDVATATPCRCSTVYYSLTSACAICQEGQFLTWSEWNGNCTSVYTTFPEPIPPGTRVPNWAYVPIGANDLWNVASAEAADYGPESTGTVAGPSTITGYVSTSTSGSTSTTNPGGNSGGKSINVGAIAGGVVGGVVALVALLGILLLRRRNSNRVASSPLINTNQYPPSPLVGEKPNLGYNLTGSTMAPSFPSMTAGSPMKLYDPSDPTTFPPPVNTGTINGPAQPVVPSDPALHPVRIAIAHDGAGAGYPGGYLGGPEL